ncbi:MAG: homocysteine S-methyltransferase family protein, partial [Marinovum sp.]|nr:homocysteine S-methyltransferase family protein [Marinovum sp.]
MTNRKTRIEQLHDATKKRILLLDGSWGVMFQKMGLSEDDYRNDHFNTETYPGQMKGNNDILCLTRPDRVSYLHDAYFEAGADITETNTFSATTIAMDDYNLKLQDVIDINFEGAKLARASA